MSEDADTTRPWGVLSPERWKKLEGIYHTTLPMTQDERRAFLARACAEDNELRHEAESLLAADDAAGDFLSGDASALGLEALAIAESRSGEMSLLSIGDTVDGRYEIVEKLNTGGMGEVYKARDTRVANRSVVIKVLKEEWLKNEWVVSRFKQEVAVLAKISDPGVVGIIDAGAMPKGHPHLVLQFVEGVELSHLIREARGGLDFAEVADIIKQAGRTLTAAHEADVVHRDLKPENIMVRRQTSGGWQVTILDFGIAKVKDDAVDSAPVTDFIVGTMQYISPEQLSTSEIKFLE